MLLARTAGGPGAHSIQILLLLTLHTFQRKNPAFLPAPKQTLPKIPCLQQAWGLGFLLWSLRGLGFGQSYNLKDEQAEQVLLSAAPTMTRSPVSLPLSVNESSLQCGHINLVVTGVVWFKVKHFRA